MKRCNKCGKEKEDFKFHLNKRRSDGLDTICKECINKYKREYNKTCGRSSKLYYKFNITEAQYELMLKSQNGVCAICGQPETAILNGIILALSVDHDHKTGKIRGLLCSNCNHGIGKFKDDPELLRKAAQYLEK